MRGVNERLAFTGREQMRLKAEQARSRAARPRVVARGGDSDRALDLDPRSAYELLTRQMVAEMGRELREIRLRVNGLIFVTVGAVIVDLLLRLAR